jgi:hypothetical protein
MDWNKENCLLEIWNSRTLPQTKQWPLLPCCSLIWRWPRAKNNFQCNIALSAVTDTKQYNKGTSNLQLICLRKLTDQIGGKELHVSMSSSIQSIWSNVNTGRTVQPNGWTNKEGENNAKNCYWTWTETPWSLLRMAESRTLIVLSKILIWKVYVLVS